MVVEQDLLAVTVPPAKEETVWSGQSETEIIMLAEAEELSLALGVSAGVVPVLPVKMEKLILVVVAVV